MLPPPENFSGRIQKGFTLSDLPDPPCHGPPRAAPPFPLSDSRGPVTTAMAAAAAVTITTPPPSSQYHHHHHHSYHHRVRVVYLSTKSHGGAFGLADTAKGAFSWQIIHQGVCLVGRLYTKGCVWLADYTPRGVFGWAIAPKRGVWVSSLTIK
ncbi:hypothetical protein Tco_1257756, partial [Tanacetum coccineum]